VWWSPSTLEQVGRLDFEAVDPARFRRWPVVREAALRGGAAPAVMNAANEVAVAAFLEGQIAFTEIARLVAEVTESFQLPDQVGWNSCVSPMAGRVQATRG